MYTSNKFSITESKRLTSFFDNNYVLNNMYKTKVVCDERNFRIMCRTIGDKTNTYHKWSMSNNEPSLFRELVIISVLSYS